ncbi:MAG: tetratricopeptide repeat protein [Gammaproteobacteria bacterium]|nr:tetratricopeptide repeat protein [Gammaproteobacteria bacterium]
MATRTDVATLMADAAALYGQGQFGRAAALAEAVLARGPSAPQAMYLLGLCRLAEGRWEDGVAQLEAALAAAPGNVDYRANLMRARAFRSQHREVIRLLDPLLEERPDILDIYQPLAAAKWEVGDRAGAISVYRQLIEKRPNDIAAHRNLGNALLQNGQRDEAVGILRRAATLNPEDRESQLLLVEADCEAVLRLPPGHPSEQEVAERARALLADITDPALRVRIGILLCRTNRLDEAIALIERHLPELDPPRRAPMYLELSNMKLRQLRLEEGQALLAAAIALDPKDKGPMAPLAACACAAGPGP